MDKLISYAIVALNAGLGLANIIMGSLPWVLVGLVQIGVAVWLLAITRQVYANDHARNRRKLERMIPTIDNRLTRMRRDLHSGDLDDSEYDELRYKIEIGVQLRDHISQALRHDDNFLKGE